MTATRARAGEPASSRGAPHRFDRVDALTDPDALSTVLGTVRAIERTVRPTPGFSNARHERLTAILADGQHRKLALKRVAVADDWTLRRAGDRVGREGALLAEPSLAAVWESVANPYLAFAIEGGIVALLMNDLSDHLLPDVREPIGVEREDELLGALAAMHARFAGAPALDLPWLARPRHYADVLGPAILADRQTLALMPASLAATIERGWRTALDLLPARTCDALMRPPVEWEERWRDLPRTLIHGDSKIANFAFVGGGSVAAFDWAFVGAAPAAIEVGWYLAVNSTRLARPKEEVLRAYRAHLESQAGHGVADDEWHRTESAAIVAGSLMLLWSKAAALESDTDRARREWGWWCDRLVAAVDQAP